MANDQVSVEISIEERAALKALAQLTKGIEKFESTSVRSVKKTDAAWSSFKGNLGAIAASGAIRAIASGLGDLVSGSIEAAASAEKINTRLQVLTGSAEAANKLFKELTEYSAKTPFQLQGIAEASAQLLSFGFSADSVQERIAKIGEVAAGSGSDLKEVALIYGQVAAAGKLTGERLLQLQERAVPIGAALAKSMGVAESEVRELVSSGVVGFKDFEKAFNSLSEAGGMFEGAVTKQSQTLSGVVSTLKDNFFILQQTIGDTFRADLVEGAQVIIVALQDLTKAVVSNKDNIKSAIGFVRDYIDVYSTFASEAVKAETPVDKINKEIEKQAKLLDEIQKVRDQFASEQDSWFGASPEMLEQQNKKLKEQEKVIFNLVQQKQAVLKADADAAELERQKAAEAKPAVNDFRAKADDQVNKQILEQRKMLQFELNLLEQERAIKEAETKLAKGELNAEQMSAELEVIRAHEEEKARIATQIQGLKDSKIRDGATAALAEKKRIAQEEIAIAQSQAKAEKAIADARVAEQQRMVAGFGVALNQAAGLAKKGTNEQKALATAAATINTYAAATRAFRDYPYPANIAVMATTIAAGLAQVSNIQRQSFQTGGVVGGFGGATNGTDNTVANVRTGEMVLNGNQQRQLFDIASGRETKDQEPRVLEITSIVQVDEREIARAVRNQRLEGFSI